MRDRFYTAIGLGVVHGVVIGTVIAVLLKIFG